MFEQFEVPQDQYSLIATVLFNAFFFGALLCKKIFKAKELSPMTQEILKALQKPGSFKIHYENCLKSDRFKLDFFSDRFYKVEVRYAENNMADILDQISAKEKKLLYKATRELYSNLLLNEVKA